MRTRLTPALLSTLLVLGAAPTIAVAQQPAAVLPAAVPTIRVSGTGEVKVTPDQAHIDLAVESFASTAKAASEENARTMERVIQALVRAGVPRTEIQTRNYAVYPEYLPNDTSNTPRIRGYRVSNMVTARTTDLARVGTLLDVALGAGANRVEGVRFSLKNPAEASNRALQNAVQQARSSAEAMASALGVRLGRVLDASSSAEPPRPLPVMMRMDMEMASYAAKAPTPIQPGEQTVSATAWLVYAIEGGR